MIAAIVRTGPARTGAGTVREADTNKKTSSEELSRLTGDPVPPFGNKENARTPTTTAKANCLQISIKIIYLNV